MTQITYMPYVGIVIFSHKSIAVFNVLKCLTRESTETSTTFALQSFCQIAQVKILYGKG